MSKIVKIEYYWDTSDPCNEGWYAMGRDETGEIVDDSMKVWFGVDVDDYDKDQGDELGQALREAYPDAEVVAE